MQILVLNIGSSSIKYQVFAKDLSQILSGAITGIGTSVYSWPENKNNICHDHSAAINALAVYLDNKQINPEVIAHRVVHGGNYFNGPTVIDNDVMTKIAQLDNLAPLHNPIQKQAIYLTLDKFPNAKQVAFFDTAFHQTIANTQKIIPINIDENIQNYGFHGINYDYIVSKLQAQYSKQVNTIILHLGNGASICAVKAGQSYATSMGMTPNSGLIMGTRSGNVDPGLFLYLHNNHNMDIVAIDKLLNQNSGLKALAGSSDMQELEALALANDPKAILAISAFVERIKFYLGGYLALLSEVDCIVFTGGIGENSSYIRSQIINNLINFNLKIDPIKNTSRKNSVISHENSIPILVIKANEELHMAKISKNLI